MRDIFGDHGLAQACGAAQDKVAAPGEEVEGKGALDQGAVDFLGPVPLKLGQGFEAVQLGQGEAASSSRPRRAAASVSERAISHQLARTPVPGGGAGHQVVERVGGKEQAELLQLCDQITAWRWGSLLEVRSS